MDKFNLDLNGKKIELRKDNNVWFDITHESTSNMLNLIDKYTVTNKTVFDVGTGTGILAIYSKMRGAKHVTAVDNSASCLEWARKNIRINDVEDIHVEIGDLSEGIEDKFDIVIANLPGQVQVENIKDIDKNLKEDGLLFISWYNKFDFEHYTFYLNWEIVEHIPGKEYDCYVLRRKDE